MRRIVLSIIAGLCVALAAFSHMGALHPAGDTVAIAAPLLAGFGLVAALLVRSSWLSGGLLLWLGVWGYHTFWPSGPPGNLLLYQKNLLYRNTNLSGVAEDILATGAEVVTLQEVSDTNKAILQILADTHPYSHVCDFWRWADLVILSKYPLLEPGCSERRVIAYAQIDRGDQIISVASMHLSWPYPYSQASRLRSVEAALSALPQPVVIGADLNMHPNSRVSRRIAHLTGTSELRQLLPTFYLRGLPLYLDHILAPGGTVERRPLLGSDHYGLLGRLRLE